MTTPSMTIPAVRCRGDRSPEPYSPTSLERMRDTMRFYDVDSVAPKMLATVDHERGVFLGLIQRLADRLGPDEWEAARAEVDHELAAWRRVEASLDAMGIGR